MSETLDCKKCGAALSASDAVNGYVKCDYCGIETSIARAAPQPGPVDAPSPIMELPPQPMPSASGGSAALGVGITVSVIVLALVGTGVAYFFMGKAAPRRHRGPVTWSTSASQYRGKLGKRFTFRCPAGGAARSVWGSGPYTDDSSVCTAAVHAGLISFAAGGRVTVEIVTGLGSYASSERNGVRAGNFGTFGGSFVFPKVPTASPASVARPAATKGGRSRGPVRVSWSTSPNNHRGKLGHRFVYVCPPRGRKGSLWGSNPYTADSSVCTAGVHAGVITMKKGGRVEIVIEAGRASYPGSLKHGVRSGKWAAYGGSFRVAGSRSGSSAPTKPADLPTPP